MVRLTGRAFLCIVTVLIAYMAPAQAAREMPPFWVALSVGGAELDAGPDAQPPAQTTEPVATVAAGETVVLRAKLVGGRRAYMMWPDTYANVGANTTVLAHGFDLMEYQVQTETFFGSGKWTVTEEKYTWNVGGQGALSPLDAASERVSWTAPNQPGDYQISVTGEVKFHFRRQAPGGVVENDEDSGAVARTFNITVGAGAAPAGTMTQQQALQHILSRFNNLGSGPVEGTLPDYVASAGFWNNVYSVFDDDNDKYVCGGWQGRVLEMLDAMRNGTATEKQVFEQYDYGPVHAYFGGHQAVVIYPKGTDWQQTGTVLDPWPNQRPETFSIADWKSRFWFGVAPSSVYENQYPLTGAATYPTPRLKIPADHMAILRRLSKSQRDQYLGLTNQTDRDTFIGALPPGATDTTAVAVHSPVQMLITDTQGRRVGWVDAGTFAYEIPGVDVDCFPEGGTDHGMVALLPQGDYSVQITGNAPGTFGFTRAVPTPAGASPLTHKLNIPVQAGEQYSCTLSSTTAETPLVGPGGAMIALDPISVSGGAVAGGGTTTTTQPVGGTTTTTVVTTPSGGTPAGGTPAGGAATATGVSITTPREGDRIVGRVTVAGTGRPGALIVVSTEVRAQDDDELLRDVPGSRHKINDDGTWQVWVAAPVLPDNVMEPLYFIIKAKWKTPTEESPEARVKVFRAE